MTDNEIELLVQAFILPPPVGFTEFEKRQILDWVKSPSAFIEIAERRKLIGTYLSPVNEDK
jgi:hypothetical protein